MIGGGLLAGIAALALADSLNPATIVVITLILLTVSHRPVGSAVTFVLGAMSTVFALGMVIFLGASLEKQWDKLVRRSYSISHRIFDEYGYLAQERDTTEPDARQGTENHAQVSPEGHASSQSARPSASGLDEA